MPAISPRPHRFVVTERTLADCQQRCHELSACQGVEFQASSGRCELWVRANGIGSSKHAVGYQCFRYVPFEPVDGGEGRECRGDNAQDDNPGYYTLYTGIDLNYCRALCVSTSSCQGVEYSEAGRCEVWTRSGGILATAGLNGYTCLRRLPRATTSLSPPATTMQTVQTMQATPTMQTTQTTQTAQTTQATSTTQTSQTTQTVQIAQTTRTTQTTLTTQTTQTTTTATALTTATGTTETLTSGPPMLVFSPVNGGVGRACRGADPLDNSPDYYVVVGGQLSFNDCRAECELNAACQGIEHQAGTGRCEIWIRPEGIGSSVSASGFQCFRYGEVFPTTTFTTTTYTTTAVVVDPAAFEAVDGGTDRACRGVGAPAPSPSDYAAYSEPTLLACMSRCVVTLGCLGIEFQAGGARCEAWVRPGGLASAPVAGFECFRYLDGPTQFSYPPNPQGSTQYIVHFMPWFRGANSTPPHAAWCASYGNSYYDSALGTYDLTDPTVVRAHLDEMQDAGIDGLWIDYQTNRWDTVCDLLVAEIRPRGMRFAIVVDSAINPNILAELGQKVASWTSEPHYYRHLGTPIVPIFNSPDTIFTALPTPALYLSRFEVAKPFWAHDTYPWINSDAVSNGQTYYRELHPFFVTGAAYCGFRDCYPDRTLAPPLYDQLQPTLATASQYGPAFVQLLTWNDFSEGTMLEPSWARPAGQCRAICAPGCDTVADCFNGVAFHDCAKPAGALYGPGPAVCGATGNLSARADLDVVRQHIQAERSALRPAVGRRARRRDGLSKQ